MKMGILLAKKEKGNGYSCHSENMEKVVSALYASPYVDSY
jgi:hypothetical protein